MAIEIESFDAPVPGMGLTHELGARPWQSPPQQATLEQALDFYLPKLTDPKMAARALDLMEKNIPITAICETLTLGGVMQGLHTIDVAVLVNPVLTEPLEGMAKNAGIDYIVGDVADDEEPDPSLIREAIESLQDIDEEELEEEREEIADEKEEKPNKGLMARRGSK